MSGGASKYLFGPVNSRRLGRSLGIDLIPHKTCSLNCVYCECGKTTDLTTRQMEYYPLGEIQAALDTFFESGGQADYVTFAGSGEPLLYSRFGELTAFIKEKYSDVKIALLTNSTLLNDHLESLSNIDLLLPSLDAVSNNVFAKINRPAKGLLAETLIDNLVAVREVFNGEMWLEIFVVPEINDTPDELKMLKDAVGKIKPDRIQLNTLDRPGVVDWIKPASVLRLNELVPFFAPISTEVVAFGASSKGEAIDPLETVVLDAISRRPCTVDDLHIMTSFSHSDISVYLDSLIQQGVAKTEKGERGEFFSVCK